MTKIPTKLRKGLAADPYYKKCAITGRMSGKIDFHHNLIFAGSQVQERFCIIPLSKQVHDDIVYYKERVDWIMCNRATDAQLKRYSKAVNYIAMRERLNKKFGVYQYLSPHRLT